MRSRPKVSAVKIVNNIKVTDEARDWLLRHYTEPDVDHPSSLRSIPKLRYSLANRGGSGVRISGPAYYLVKGEPHRMMGSVVTPFDDGRKFLAVQFGATYDEAARYLVEYFDGVWYVLKE